MVKGFMEKLEWASSYGKKQCRNLFWKMKAALKRRRKRQFKFHYDPSSYALNFDDGYCHCGVGTSTVQLARLQGFSEYENVIWVYVFWIKL
ncbi:hypothetical protein CXB51_026798 [Gossypium anomalum]|uniref:Uncharacterized protein n=1 Tax=Gossypium anomalum TaxID=47600 RepID=A0A8J6CP45_9ROSI|nr:hypothetical protein CXB51_026798 [Gossypium anomalum]